MRTLGQLLLCVLLAVPSVRAASVPWDLECSDARAATIAHAVERHIVLHSTRLAVYLEVPSAQLRAIVKLPLVRELVRSLGLQEIERVLAVAGTAKPVRPGGAIR